MLVNRYMTVSPRQLLAAFAIALTVSMTSNFVYAAATPANSTGLITLHGKRGDVQSAENDSNVSCTIEVPAAGAGRSYDIHLNNPDSPCHDVRVSSIAMENMPAATQILLTDDYFCDTTLGSDFDIKRDPETNRNFWIKLRTGAAGGKLAEESISALTFKGFASNRDEYTGEYSHDVQVDDYKLSGGSDRITYTLSCLRITSSTNKATQRGAYIAVPAGDWGEPVKESNSPDIKCTGFSAITARKHNGDENGDTFYRCAEIDGVTRIQTHTSKSFPECGINLDAKYDKDENRYKACNEAQYDNSDMAYLYFSCPINQVMVSRAHEGDENGDTTYTCATLYQGDKPVSVWPGTWNSAIEESDSEFACPLEEVMVGRAHKGDENNQTKYLCAKLRAGVSSPI